MFRDEAAIIENVVFIVWRALSPADRPRPRHAAGHVSYAVRWARCFRLKFPRNYTIRNTTNRISKNVGYLT
jgi:hypothetical protein